MAEKHDVKEIEESLKRMLNMQPGGGGQEEKQADTNLKQEHESNMKQGSQNLDGRQEQSSEDRTVQNDHPHQLMDPAIVGIEIKGENQQQPTPKKKKKKPKKKNKQGDADKQTALDLSEDDTGQSQKERKTAQSKNQLGEKKEDDWESEDSEDGRPSVAFLKTAVKYRYLDDTLTPAILKELEREKIFPLKKKSSKFPQAKYFCRLCEYHCDNVPVCRQHYTESRHKRRVEIAVQERTLRNLPHPSKRHLESLDRILLDIYQQFGLSDQDLQERADITSSIQNFLNQSIPGIELRVYGSSLSGFGLKSSDLNIDLVVPDRTSPAQLLTRIYKLLVNCDTYQNVRSNFLAKVPSVLFDSPCGTVHCEISVNSDLAYYTSRLLAIYSRVDPRVRQLAVIFRHWAKICQIDDQQKGSLPSYTFGLMTVFFLQQCTLPLLPVLWKDLSEEALKRPKTPKDILTMLTDLDLERQDWVCRNEKSIGQLWINLLLFYGVSFNVTDHVITIRQKKTLPRSEKKWKTRRLAIEDPFSSKRNVAKTLFSIRIFDYVYNCLRKGCIYFSLPTNHKNMAVDHDRSRVKKHHQVLKQKEPDLAMPKTYSKDKEVSYQTQSRQDKDRKKTSSESELTFNKLPDVDSSVATLISSEKDKSSNVETVLTSSRTSSEFGIKENDLIAKCKDISIDLTEDSDAGIKIKGHSFLSSGEISVDVNDQERLEVNAMEDTCSDFSDPKEKLSVDVSDLESVIESRTSVLVSKTAGLDAFKENDSGLCADELVRRSNEAVKDSKPEVRTNDRSKVCDTQLEDNDNVSTEEQNLRLNSSQAFEPSDVASCKETTEQTSNDPESSDLENILTLHTQDDTDSMFEKTNADADISSSETGQSTGKEDISVHVFLEEDEIIDEGDNDVEDIIDHSFLTDDSALMSLLESTHSEDSFREKEKRNENEIPNKGLNVSGSRSGSESDLELESPESSPVKKLERPRSPEDAEYNFIFTVDSLTDGKGPSIFCGICEKEGHLKSNCPEEQLQEVKPLPPVTKQHLKLLSNVVRNVPSDFQLSQRELDMREEVRWDLECFIRELFPGGQVVFLRCSDVPTYKIHSTNSEGSKVDKSHKIHTRKNKEFLGDAELSLFGSSENGFGFHYSDLDICVTFRGKNPEDLNFVELIEALSKKLKTHKSFYNVFPITTAKVPIVKFVHRPTRLEGDISLYNILAQQNTRLLYCYSLIDPRVVILGYAIKVFAKVCDIGDASKGSLSSYAYMLLLFHYLQHTKPPVIPVLQELRDGDERAEVMVDGWNAWFYDDIKNLPKVWPGCGQNRQNVGELWLGLFRYYVEEFNIEEDVVTIRQFEPLTKFEKLWNRKCIAIEDPFDLSHNLGAGLSRKMHKYIMSALINARELYGTSVTGPPDGFNTLADYFFDRELLTEGDVPNDRLCRVCSKIGHIAKECPRVLARKEREAEERRRKEEQRKAQEMMNKGGTSSGRGNNLNRPKQQGRSHPGPSRSLSDPVDTSPRRPQDRRKMFINRQFSSGANLQSYNNAQGYHPSSRHHGLSNPTSPQPIPTQTYSRDRRPQSNSPRSYSQSSQPQSPIGFNPNVHSFNSGAFNNQSFRNPFQWANQNDNSARRNFHPPIQNLVNLSHFGTNQNQNNKQPLLPMPNQMPVRQQSSGNRGYISSPNQNQGYQHRKQQPNDLLVNEDKDYSTSPNRNQAYNRSHQPQQQQQGYGSKRQVTMTTGSDRLPGMGVTVSNEYYHGNKGKK